jgi:hypothetical protein
MSSTVYKLPPSIPWSSTHSDCHGNWRILLASRVNKAKHFRNITSDDIWLFSCSITLCQEKSFFFSLLKICWPSACKLCFRRLNIFTLQTQVSFSQQLYDHSSMILRRLRVKGLRFKLWNSFTFQTPDFLMTSSYYFLVKFKPLNFRSSVSCYFFCQSSTQVSCCLFR